MQKPVFSSFIAAIVLVVGLTVASMPGTRAFQEGAEACPIGAGATPAASSVATPAASGEETSVRFGEVDALLWPAGNRGVVLAHGAVYDAASWRPQAEALAAEGITVLALEPIDAEAILAGIGFLREACGLSEVALVGASAGGSGALQAAAREQELVDTLILLSASGDVSALGEIPKLFVASEGEGMADTVRRMAEEAPGDENVILILPGDAHAQAIFPTEQGETLLREIIAFLTEE